MTDKEAIAIERCNQLIKVEHANWIGISNQVAIETVLNLIQTQQAEIDILKQEKATAWEDWNIINEYCEQEKQKYKAEIEKKDKIIDNSINEIEKIRQYFSEDLQVEFIRILEILKDKKVIDW
jgi:hypothetical protein